MLNYTIYDNSTGRITGLFSSSTEQNIALNLANKSYVEGKIDGSKYYISNGNPVLIPEKPVADENAKYKFDWTTKTWSVDTSVLNQFYRNKRNTLLKKSIDKVNPVWYASLTTDQQAELQAYRTALLNVPQQSGFPTNITWPTKPTWLS